MPESGFENRGPRQLALLLLDTRPRALRLFMQHRQGPQMGPVLAHTQGESMAQVQDRNDKVTLVQSLIERQGYLLLSLFKKSAFITMKMAHGKARLKTPHL